MGMTASGQYVRAPLVSCSEAMAPETWGAEKLVPSTVWIVGFPLASSLGFLLGPAERQELGFGRQLLVGVQRSGEPRVGELANGLAVASDAGTQIGCEAVVAVAECGGVGAAQLVGAPLPARRVHLVQRGRVVGQAEVGCDVEIEVLLVPHRQAGERAGAVEGQERLLLDGHGLTRAVGLLRVLRGAAHAER